MEQLRKGLGYAIEHNLSVREMEVLLIFMNGPNNTTSISNMLKIGISAASSIVTRLKLKGLIEVVECEGRFKVYKFKSQ